MCTAVLHKRAKVGVGIQDIHVPDEENTGRNLIPRALVGQWMRDAVHRLYAQQPALAGAVAADGGRPADDVFAALPTDARPTSRRTVTAACSGVNSDQLSMKVDFNTDGTVQIIAKGGALPPWISLNNVMYTLT